MRGKSLPCSDETPRFGKGEFICLLGPKGCVKTTLLNLLDGL